MARPPRPSSDPRRVALRLLDRLERSSRTLDRLVDEALARQHRLDRRDRALVFALVFGVQRWRGRLDWVADHYADRPLARSAPTVRNILRLALFQLLFLSRVPPSAAVHTAVGLARAEAPWAAGFVNALLRRALDAGGRVVTPPAPADPLAALAVEAAFPEWLAARWVARDGPAAARERCRAANRLPPLTVRTHGPAGGREGLRAAWREAGIDADPTPFAPEGL